MLLLALITVKIGVFGLFHPVQLHVEAPPNGVLVANNQVKRALDIHLGDPAFHVTSRDGGQLNFTLSVPGKITRTFHGTLDTVSASGELVAVITMDREHAVAAVVAAEYPDGTPIEALKAAAVLARSYYAASPVRHTLFDFCDTTHCQFHRAPPAAGKPAATATLATEGLVIAYQNAPFAALYSASCGGRTRTAMSVGLSPQPYPYFAVECRACLRNAAAWVREIRGEPDGTERFRLANKIPSNNYTIERDGETTRLLGRGDGHGLGLCQHGATAMAAGGTKFREILNFYYPNTTVIR